MRTKTNHPAHRIAVCVLIPIALCALSVCSLAQADPLDNWHGPASFPSGFGTVNGVAYGNGTFIAVGNNGALALSPDGSSWTQYFSPPVINYGGVMFGGGQFFAYGYWNTSGGLTNYILSSSNGHTWAKIYEFYYVGSGGNQQGVKAAASGNNRVVFVGSDRIITTTLPATNWTESQLPPVTPLSGVTFGMGRFVACGRYVPGGSGTPRSHILSSLDGISWRYDYGPDLDDESVSAIAYGNGMFVAPWRTNNAPVSGFLVSSNLTLWSYVPISDTNNLLAGAAAFGGGQFIASLSGRAFTSPDGSAWTYRTNALGASAVTYGLGTFLTSSLRQSDVFANPTSSPPSYLALTMFPGVSITGTEGQTYRIECTTNLDPSAVWSSLTNVTLPYSPYLWIDTSSSASSRRFYRSIQVE